MQWNMQILIYQILEIIYRHSSKSSSSSQQFSSCNMIFFSMMKLNKVGGGQGSRIGQYSLFAEGKWLKYWLMVGTALQSASALNINACLIHWHPWDLPLTSESDFSLLVAVFCRWWDVRCNPLVVLFSWRPGRVWGNWWDDGMWGDVITFISHQVLSGIHQRPPSLSIKWKYLMVFIIFRLQKSQHKRCKANKLGYFSFFCGWRRKVLFPGHLMKME